MEREQRREQAHHAHIIRTQTPYIIYTLLFHNGFNVAHVSTWGRSSAQYSFSYLFCRRCFFSWFLIWNARSTVSICNAAVFVLVFVVLRRLITFYWIMKTWIFIGMTEESLVFGLTHVCCDTHSICIKIYLSQNISPCFFSKTKQYFPFTESRAFFSLVCVIWTHIINVWRWWWCFFSPTSFLVYTKCHTVSSRQQTSTITIAATAHSKCVCIICDNNNSCSAVFFRQEYQKKKRWNPREEKFKQTPRLNGKTENRTGRMF